MHETRNPLGLRRIANVLALLGMLTVNVLSNALPFNGLTAEEVTARFDVLFAPAGYAFAIWGLIYVGLFAFIIFQALPSQRDNQRLRRIGWAFVVSCVANATWLLVWHYQRFLLSIVIMAALLISLITIYLRLKIGHAEVPAPERWAVHIPFSLYLGWITVATVVNITTTLDYLGWTGWGLSDTAWFIILLIVVESLAAIVSFTRADAAYQGVLIWALIAVAVENADRRTVPMITWIAVLVLALILVGGLLLKRARKMGRRRLFS